MQSENAKPETTLWQKEPVRMIAIEQIRTPEGTVGWSWDAFGEDRRLAGGVMFTLSQCVDGMRQFLRDEGIAP